VIEDAGVDVDSPHWQDSKRGTCKLADLAAELASGTFWDMPISFEVLFLILCLWEPSDQQQLATPSRLLHKSLQAAAYELVSLRTTPCGILIFSGIDMSQVFIESLASMKLPHAL
jgi:hypothetical protein